MTAKVLRKSTLALVLALLTLGSGKAFIQGAPPTPIPSHPTSHVADIGGGAPDPCGSGQCIAPVEPTIKSSHATVEVADIGGGAPDPCGSGQCVVGV